MSTFNLWIILGGIIVMFISAFMSVNRIELFIGDQGHGRVCSPGWKRNYKGYCVRRGRYKKRSSRKSRNKALEIAGVLPRQPQNKP